MARAMLLVGKYGKIALKILGGLVLLVMAVFLSIFLVCLFRPELVGTIVSHQLKQYTGCIWELNDLEPSLLPPGVRFQNIAVYEEADTPDGLGEPVFSAKSLVLEPNILKLLAGGRIEFRSVVLDTPVFRLNPTLFLLDEEMEEGIEEGVEGEGKGSLFSTAAAAGPVASAEPAKSAEPMKLVEADRPFHTADSGGEISLAMRGGPQPRKAAAVSHKPASNNTGGGDAATPDYSGKDVSGAGVSSEALPGQVLSGQAQPGQALPGQSHPGQPGQAGQPGQPGQALSGPDVFSQDKPGQPTGEQDATVQKFQEELSWPVTPEVLENAQASTPYGPPVPFSVRRMQRAVSVIPRLSVREEMGLELAQNLRYFRRKLTRDWGKRLWNLRIINGDFTQRDEGGTILLGVHNINVDVSLNPWYTSVVKGVFSLPQDGLLLDSEVSFQLPPKFTKTFFEATLDVGASLTLPGEQPILGRLSTDLHWSRSNHIVVDKLTLEAEGDRIDALMDFDPSTLTAVGRLDISQLSLPRWFYFARNLPPGLQEALHTISGTVNFSTDLVGIWGTELVATAGNLDLVGSIGVEEFVNPVIKVDLFSDAVDADVLFPFLATSSAQIPEPVKPEFSMPYLAPFPGPGGDDAPDVGYDVRVATHKSRVHDIAAENLLVTVVPVGETMTRVDIDCEKIGRGSLKGRLDIDKTLTVMTFDVRKMDLSLLPENKGSSVTFGGRVTGKTTLTVDVKDTVWADIWGIEFAGDITDQSITLTGADGWTLAARGVGFSGKGRVNTLRSEGLTLDGAWKAVSKGVHSSWHPKGDDAVTYTLKGVFAWPDEAESKHYSGIQRIGGDIVAEGVLHLPLGNQIIPVRGTLRSPMEWNIQKDLLRLTQYHFRGMDSVSNGTMQLDGGNKETVFTASQRFSISPRTVLSAWKLLPEAIQVPKLMTGSTDFKATAQTATFSNLRFDADGAITTGTVVIRQPDNARKNMLWDIKLAAKRLEFDNYLVPPTPEEKRNPSKVPWDLTFLEGMDFDATLKADHARFRDVNFNQFQLESTLKNKALSAMVLSSDVYGGRVTGQVQGRIEPTRSMVTLSKANLVMKSLNLAAAFADQGKGSDYGGKADIVFDLSGTMRCDADFPAALSGQWSLEIRDGLYPAFVGSKTAGLRNTFSKASASGKMTKGVLSTSNFILSGSVVDMKGGGELDLGKRKVDMKANVTVAGMPTFPVDVFGEFDTFTINVGGNFITGTAHVAGSTIFNIFKGILELPGRAVSGVNSLLTPKNKIEKKEYKPYRH